MYSQLKKKFGKKVMQIEAIDFATGNINHVINSLATISSNKRKLSQMIAFFTIDITTRNLCCEKIKNIRPNETGYFLK